LGVGPANWAVGLGVGRRGRKNPDCARGVVIVFGADGKGRRGGRAPAMRLGWGGTGRRTGMFLRDGGGGDPMMDGERLELVFAAAKAGCERGETAWGRGGSGDLMVGGDRLGRKKNFFRGNNRVGWNVGSASRPGDGEALALASSTVVFGPPRVVKGTATADFCSDWGGGRGMAAGRRGQALADLFRPGKKKTRAQGGRDVGGSPPRAGPRVRLERKHGWGRRNFVTSIRRVRGLPVLLAPNGGRGNTSPPAKGKAARFLCPGRGGGGFEVGGFQGEATVSIQPLRLVEAGVDHV